MSAANLFGPLALGAERRKANRQPNLAGAKTDQITWSKNMLTLHRTSIRFGLVTFLVSFFMLITGTAVHAKESEVCSYYKGGSAAPQNRIRLCVWVKFEI